MKELSIKQKAKRYEEALEKARQIHDAGRVSGIELTTCEEIFPELAESEDERIRKALIYHYQGDGCICTNEYRIDYKDICAWLEKQGEPVEMNPTEFDTRLQALIGKFDRLPKEELIGSLSFWINVVQNDGTYKSDEKQDEQKPAWSEEDDYNLQCMIAKVASDIQKGNVGRNNELIDWLKSLKDRVQPQQKQKRSMFKH